MEDTTIAHMLPELYLAVLQRATALEAVGQRAEALLIRRAAVAAYSRAFDLRATHQLEALRDRAERVLDGLDRPRTKDPETTALGWSRSA
ncbi:MAG: hypothetical protein ABI598_00850 [Chloroflexota bacterium]